jgi:phospholipid transport system substrate-binding protein
MSKFVSMSARRAPMGLPALLGHLRTLLLTLLAALSVLASPAAAADPAVAYMDRVARELIAAQRARTPEAFRAAIQRHGDIPAIGLSSLGDYRPRLEAADRQPYLNGMVRFISRYAAAEAPKYAVSHVTFQPGSRAAKYGLMVDSTVHLTDGSSYDVSWRLVRAGGDYKVQDAQVLGFWMTPFLKKLFEDYIAENNGNVKALVMVLNR